MELIRQIEFGEEISFMVALKDCCQRNLLPLLPLIAFWSLLWFVIILIEALLSKFRPREHRDLNPENIAKTLGNWDVFSWTRLFFYYFEKAIRMIVFLIVPCIVWHEPDFGKGFKESMSVLKNHAGEFIAGFIITEAASTIIFVPPTIIFILSRTLEIPSFIWILVIVYISLAWSYSMYLEQMYAAQLYLWHRRWYKEQLISKELNKPFLKLQDIPKPSLLDDLNDLKI